MPLFLLHQTAAGDPVGIYSENRDYYIPEYDHLRAAGRSLVLSKLPSVSWEDFTDRLASTTPSVGSRWDTYFDASPSLETALGHARRDLEQTGIPEPE